MDAAPVSRASLFSPQASRSPSPAPSLNLDLEFITTTAAPSTTTDTTSDVLTFRLFSTTAPTTQIHLRSPTPEVDPWDSYCLTRKRPASYYTVPPSEAGTRRARNDAARVAIEGAAILAASALTEHSATSGTGTGTVTRRKRPGKKSRLAKRVRDRRERVLEEARKKSREGRTRWEGVDDEERKRIEAEEQSRKNREKKAKKKMREKAKKAAAKAGTDTGTGTGTETSTGGGEGGGEVGG
ncbi:hypothetical protein EDC01DRAFT_774737 [Geopyxis carbonaria]|nr:hypothetical protein EDC01DRAFT_774737 [Geopyxis carbonaria]